jgi:GTP-binding protein
MIDNPQEAQERLCKLLDWNGPVFSISALNGEGTQQLIWRLQDWLDEEKRKTHVEQDKQDGSYVAEDPRFDETRSDAIRPENS